MNSLFKCGGYRGRLFQFSVLIVNSTVNLAAEKKPWLLVHHVTLNRYGKILFTLWYMKQKPPGHQQLLHLAASVSESKSFL